MMRGMRPAGTPLSTLMFLNTLSAGAFSRPAMCWSSSFIRLSRSATNESTAATVAGSVTGVADGAGGAGVAGVAAGLGCAGVACGAAGLAGADAAGAADVAGGAAAIGATNHNAASSRQPRLRQAATAFSMVPPRYGWRRLNDDPL